MERAPSGVPFDVGEPVRVLDLSPSGALIEAQQPLAGESVQSVKLMIDGQPTVTEAKVKRRRTLRGISRQSYQTYVKR